MSAIFECPRCSVNLMNPGAIKIIPETYYTEARIEALEDDEPGYPGHVIRIDTEKNWWEGIDHRECAHCGERLDGFVGALDLREVDHDGDTYRY